MARIPQPPLQHLLITHMGVQIFLYDATHGHTREGWNHHQDRYLVVQWDPADQQDRGLVGDDLETVLLATKTDIQKRKTVTLS